jgi:hypothetical protein
MKKQTKRSLIAELVSFLKTLRLAQLKELIKNIEDFKSFVINLVISDKEKVSLQCLKDNAKAWGWPKEQQDKIGENLTMMPTHKDVWSKIDSELLDINPSRFGEATAASEEFWFSLESIDVSYRVRTEKDLFPNQEFVGMSVLKAIRKFINLVDALNCRLIEETGKPRYYVPGLETQQFFHDNEDKTISFINNGNWYYYAGASFRHYNGGLSVPCSCKGSRKGTSSWRRGGDCVSTSWASDNRFLVLEII